MNRSVNLICFFVVALILIFACNVHADIRWTVSGYDNSGGNVPNPVLLEPRSNNVYLDKDDELLISWSMHESARGFRDGFDLRIYQGSATVKRALVYKKMIDPETYEVYLPSALFDDGATYTISLRQTYDGGFRKSRRVFRPFTVRKPGYESYN